VGVRPTSFRSILTGGVLALVSLSQIFQAALAIDLEPPRQFNSLNAPANSAPLQWRTRGTAPTNTAQQSTPARGTQVRNVAQLSRLDPFDDPFGDRRIRSLAQNEPTLPLPSLEPPVPMPDSANPLPLNPRFGEPMPRRPAPIYPEDLPPGANKPCDSIYNDRNCCDEDDKCQTARQKLRDNPISQISLDITPSIKPDAANYDEVKSRRESQMGQLTSRTWKNRDGQVVAEGLMTDYQNGRVLIRTQGGQVSKVPSRELSDDDLCYLAAWWGLPSECTLGDEQFAGRNWVALTMTWKASALCHKPLYFEHQALERYGHTPGPLLEPFLSGAHFFLNIAALPYEIGIHPPNECIYALGYYRPGNCAPWLVDPIPLSLRGGLLEAGVITGGVFVLP
jgi:hypothetical protein